MFLGFGSVPYFQKSAVFIGLLLPSFDCCRDFSRLSEFAFVESKYSVSSILPEKGLRG